MRKNTLCTVPMMNALAAFKNWKESGRPDCVGAGTLYALLRRNLLEVVRSTPPVWDTEIVSNRFGRGWHTRRNYRHYVVYGLTEKGLKFANAVTENSTRLQCASGSND